MVHIWFRPGVMPSAETLYSQGQQSQHSGYLSACGIAPTSAPVVDSADEVTCAACKTRAFSSWILVPWAPHSPFTDGAVRFAWAAFCGQWLQIGLFASPLADLLTPSQRGDVVHPEPPPPPGPVRGLGPAKKKRKQGRVRRR